MLNLRRHLFPGLGHRPTASAAARSPRQRSPWLLLLVIGLWSLGMGWGIAQATEPAPALSSPQIADIGTVDPVPPSYRLGQQLYLENCATCHVGIPPAVLPNESWRQLLQSSEHYTVVLPPLVDPGRLLIWNYLRDFSRTLQTDEAVPYRLESSRFFRALHPQVSLPNPLRLDSCISCHPGANEYDFRRLTPEWQ